MLIIIAMIKDNDGVALKKPNLLHITMKVIMETIPAMLAQNTTRLNHYELPPPYSHTNIQTTLFVARNTWYRCESIKKPTI